MPATGRIFFSFFRPWLHAVRSGTSKIIDNGGQMRNVYDGVPLHGRTCRIFSVPISCLMCSTFTLKVFNRNKKKLWWGKLEGGVIKKVLLTLTGSVKPYLASELSISSGWVPLSTCAWLIEDLAQC